MLGTILIYISPIILLTVIVAIHEWGHFYFARRFGVAVSVFSIGFGKKLLSYKDRYNTEWCLSILPFGGYIKPIEDAETDDSNAIGSSMNAIATWKKLIIVLGGPFANFVLTFVLLVFIFCFFGKSTITATVDQVQQDSLAQKYGIKSGDTIVRINDSKIVSFFDIGSSLQKYKNEKNILITVKRNNELVKIFMPVIKNTDKKFVIGVMTDNKITFVKIGFFNAINEAISYMINFIGKIIMFLSSPDTSSLGGPVLIFDQSIKAASYGMVNFLFFMAILSLNLGVLNLLPIPALDGGRFWLIMLEYAPFLTKQHINVINDWAVKLSVIFLLIIFVLITFNDLARFV